MAVATVSRAFVCPPTHPPWAPAPTHAICYNVTSDRPSALLAVFLFFKALCCLQLFSHLHEIGGAQIIIHISFIIHISEMKKIKHSHVK